MHRQRGTVVRLVFATLLAFAITTMPVFLAVVITAYQAHRCCGTMGKCQQKKGKRKKEESTPLLFVYIVCVSVNKVESVSRCGTCRNHVTQVSTFCVQLPMFNFPHSNAQHSTFKHVYTCPGLCTRIPASVLASRPLYVRPGLCTRVPALACAPQPLHTHPSLCTCIPAFAHVSRPLHACPSLFMCVPAFACMFRPLHARSGLCTCIPAFARAFRPLHACPGFCTHVLASAHVSWPLLTCPCLCKHPSSCIGPRHRK
jgi:hypothetical protein